MPAKQKSSFSNMPLLCPVVEYYPYGWEKSSLLQELDAVLDSYKGSLCFLAKQNLLLHGDNVFFMKSLAELPFSAVGLETLSEHLKLVYMDPPFAVGSDFFMDMGNGRQRAYSDSWPDKNVFLEMLRQRLALVHTLLADDGSVFLHCDWRTSAHVRLLLDDVFGEKQFLSEIIWHYTGGGRSRRYFSRKHDNIYHYAKGKKWTFNIDAVRIPYKQTSNYAKGGIVAKSGKRYMPNPLGTPADDVWNIPMINPLAQERLGYPTQKPEALLERIILGTSNMGETVGDFFCGSGTTLAVAQRLGRNWIGNDYGALAVSVACQRLLNILAGSVDQANSTQSFLLCREHPVDMYSCNIFFVQKKNKATIKVKLKEFIPSLPKEAGHDLLLEGDGLYGKDKKGNRTLICKGWEHFIQSVSLGVLYKASSAPWEYFFVCLDRQTNSRSALQIPSAMAEAGALVLQVTDIFGQVYFNVLQHN